MEKLRNKDEVTSLELLKEINRYREMEYSHKIENNLELGKVELKNGKFTELRHDTLLNIIKDEFEEEITNQKILESVYKDSTGKKNQMYILTLEQCKQVLMRESKFVRRGVLEYIHKLENENKLLKENISMKDSLLLNIIKSNNDIEKAEAINKYENEYVKPLEIENKNQKIEIEKKDKKLEHKQEIIKGFTEDVSLLEKRQLLNRVVRYKGSNYKERWNELYRVFKETEHIDIKVRYESYLKIYKKGMTKVTSKLDYTEKFGHLDKLYKIALKLYEEDMKELLRNFREVVTLEG